MSITPLNDEISEKVLRLEKEQKYDEIIALFKELKTKEEVESVGKVLDTNTSLALLKSFLQWNPEEHWKISALLVGLSHQVFVKVLISSNKDHLEVLKHEALREPLQHHLTLFAHEMGVEVKKRSDEIEAFESQALKGEIKGLEEQIALLTRNFKGMDILIDRALSVGWNSGRPDIVEELSRAKETSVRMEHEHLGEQAYKTLGFAVFGKEGSEALLDEDSALEALTKLGIWYLKDYAEIGILNSVQAEQLENINDSEKREEYLKEAKESLEKIGLSAVGDFKAAHLFTRESLLNYIQETERASKS